MEWKGESQRAREREKEARLTRRAVLSLAPVAATNCDTTWAFWALVKEGILTATWLDGGGMIGVTAGAGQPGRCGVR